MVGYVRQDYFRLLIISSKEKGIWIILHAVSTYNHFWARKFEQDFFEIVLLIARIVSSRERDKKANSGGMTAGSISYFILLKFPTDQENFLRVGEH